MAHLLGEKGVTCGAGWRLGQASCDALSAAERASAVELRERRQVGAVDGSAQPVPIDPPKPKPATCEACGRRWLVIDGETPELEINCCWGLQTWLCLRCYLAGRRPRR